MRGDPPPCSESHNVCRTWPRSSSQWKRSLGISGMSLPKRVQVSNCSDPGLELSLILIRLGGSTFRCGIALTIILLSLCLRCSLRAQGFRGWLQPYSLICHPFPLKIWGEISESDLFYSHNFQVLEFSHSHPMVFLWNAQNQKQKHIDV